MEIFKIILQILIALGIFNVWLLRFSTNSEWRGGQATNMKEEFESYGLPDGAVWIIGSLKLSCAALLLLGVFLPVLAKIGAAGLTILMAGAVLMHFKVKDAPKKSLPAATLLILSLIVLFV